MKIIFILLMSIKVAYLFIDLNLAYNRNTGLIYNGQKYDPEEYPYIVSIRIYKVDRTSRSICTGSLIRPLYVLTAAHCVSKVYSGSTVNNKDFRSVSKIEINNNYSSINDAIVGDLSLLKLKGPFRHVKKYLTIGGNVKEFANLNPVECVCIGFGAINDQNELGLEGFMMTTNVRHGKKACRDYGCNLIRDTWNEYLCATTPMTSMVCPGDSGGPMICNGKLYGVCSFFYNFSDPSLPDGPMRCGGRNIQTVHVFLHFYEKWINSILPQKKKKKKNSGNMLKAHLTLHTIIGILKYRVFTSI